MQVWGALSTAGEQGLKLKCCLQIQSQSIEDRNFMIITKFQLSLITVKEGLWSRSRQVEN